MGCLHEDTGQIEMYKGVVVFTIGLIFVGENLLLLFILLQHEGVKNKYPFTLSLAVTDLIVGVCFIAISVCYMPWVGWRDGSGYLHYYTCVVILALDMVVISTVHMAVIAADRFLYIAHPFLYEKFTKSRIIPAFIAAVWILGVVTYVVFVFVQLSVLEECVSTLDGLWTPVRHGVGVLYAFMSLLAGLFYLLILVQVRKHSNAVHAIQAGTPSAMPTDKWRAWAVSLRFFVTVFGLYILMTCPGFIILALVAPEVTPNGVRFLGTMLAALNSGMNLIVLTAVDKQFRREAKKTVCGCKAFNPSPVN